MATKTTFIAVENKIHSVSNLVKKKNDLNTKINETDKKIPDHNQDNYVTTPESNKLTSENLAARLNKQI